VLTLADRGCRVVSATNPPQSFISVFYTGAAISLIGRVDPVTHPQHLRKNLVAPGIEPGPLDL
jgi:hypothetical protein